MDPENEPCKDVSCDWEGNEERFERKGLVEGACEEEVFLRGGNGASYQWD